jgi:DNA-binding PadR family transcriptional regulator
MELNTQDVILGLLQKRSYTGYEMKHLFETVFSFFFDASFGTIYPTLSKMEQLGYITKENIVQENRPNKNVYTITTLGKEQFTEYMGSPVEKETVRSDFHMRMFFGEYVEEKASVKWIEDAIAKNSKKLEDLEDLKRSALGSISGFSTKMIGLQIGIETVRAHIKVLQESLLSLRKINVSDTEQGDQK